MLRAALFAVARVLPEPARQWLARAPLAGRVANRLLGQDRLEVVEVPAGPLRGLRLEVYVATEKAYWTGTYEPETQALLAELPLDGAVAWDVGAHAGFFTLLLARRCSRVVAVEASPENAARLRRNVALNDAAVDVVEAAVDATSGPGWLEDSGRMSRLVDAGAAGVTIERVTLDELAAELPLPRFVKLDVEGAEVGALAGARELLAHGPTLLLETHGENELRAVRAVLEEARYVVRQVGSMRVLATISPRAASRAPR